MRPQVTQLSAAGNGPWEPVNRQQTAFAIGLGVFLSSGATLTYSIQHTFDDPTLNYPITISRSGTTATVIMQQHLLSVGDSVVIVNSGDSNLDGTHEVATVVDANTFTYTVANTGATVSAPQAVATPYRVYNHASLVNQTVRADGNYAFPIQAFRLIVSSYTSGTVTAIAIQGMGH